MKRAFVVMLCCACTPVTVQPVFGNDVIVGTAEPAAVMVLMDRSGSMAQPLAGDAGVTRLQAVTEWIAATAGALGGQARLGLTIYPHDGVCSPAGSQEVLVPIPSTPDAGEVAAQARGVTSSMGGTPTAASLQFIAAFPSDTAERIVVLVTDGLPNCNGANPNDCTNPAACRCTIAPAGCGTTLGDAFCRSGCLDQTSTVQVISQLSGLGTFTLVVGVGPEVTGTNASVLDAMSAAATDALTCNTDDDCFGAFACTRNHCLGPAIIARDEAALSAVTDVLAKKLALSARCRWTLEREPPAGTFHASIDGVDLPSDDVLFETPRRVRLLGDSCQTLVMQPLATLTFRAP